MFLFPIKPNIFFYDITVLPLYFMLVFQYAGTWKKYMVWMLAASAIMGFVFTPLFVILGLGVLIHWNYLCAFLSFSFIGFAAKVVVSLIFYIEKHYQMKQ